MCIVSQLISLIRCFRANEEIDKARTSSTAEIARLQAALKKAELRASSLESTLEQKVCWIMALCNWNRA